MKATAHQRGTGFQPVIQKRTSEEVPPKEKASNRIAEFELPLVESAPLNLRQTQAVKVSIFRRNSRAEVPSPIWHARVREDGEELRISTRSIQRGTALDFARMLYRAVLSFGGIKPYQEWCARQREFDAHFRHRLAAPHLKSTKATKGIA